MDPVTLGDPFSPLRWTCKSRAKLTAALVEAGWRVSSTTVGRLLHEQGYSLQSVARVAKGPRMRTGIRSSNTAGREWQPKQSPERVLVHDFPQDASGKAIPYGIYDMGRNEAWVNVGCDHDTPAFAVASIRRWWNAMAALPMGRHGRSTSPRMQAATTAIALACEI